MKFVANLLASRLRAAGIDCALSDNALVHIGDFAQLEELMAMAEKRSRYC
jgi:hypothetical protein